MNLTTAFNSRFWRIAIGVVILGIAIWVLPDFVHGFMDGFAEAVNQR